MADTVCELALTATMADLPRIADFLDAACEDSGVRDAVRFDLQLALEEACCNVLEHAYAGASGEIGINFTAHKSDVILTVRDHGRAFEPDKVSDPDLLIPLEERPVGGLGLYLMHRLMDEVRFSFSPEANILTMIRRGAIVSS